MRLHSTVQEYYYQQVARKRELGGGEGLKSLLSTEGFGRFKVVELQLQKLLVLDRFCERTRHQRTLGFLAKISFTPLLYHPGRCLGCQEKRISTRNYNLFVWSAVFQLKWNDIQKSYKSYENPLKSYCFLGYFQSLFNFGWKTVAQTSGSYCFF